MLLIHSGGRSFPQTSTFTVLISVPLIAIYSMVSYRQHLYDDVYMNRVLYSIYGKQYIPGAGFDYRVNSAQFGVRVGLINSTQFGVQVFSSVFQFFLPILQSQHVFDSKYSTTHDNFFCQSRLPYFCTHLSIGTSDRPRCSRNEFPTVFFSNPTIGIFMHD